MTPDPRIPKNAQTGGQQRPIRRAKIACTSCQARRVKCDVVETQPCWHCRNRGSPCEMTESRRGKYDRSKRKKRAALDELGHAEVLKQNDPSQSAVERRIQQEESQSVGRGTPKSATQANLENRTHVSPSSSALSSPPFEMDQCSDDGSEMLFARMADPYDSSEGSQKQTDQQISTMYLGEAFSLTFVVKTVCSPSGDTSHIPKVHYPIPPSAKDHNSPSPGTAAGLDPDVLAFLHAKGALALPSPEVCDALVEIYFRSFHPAWPVLDRNIFEIRYRQGTTSLLVLQTIFFLAVTVCSDELVKRAGFLNRREARTVFYNRAKSLYDADYETDESLLTAALFLLAFWWQKPRDQKDTWHWLGCAISLAQTHGMHRTTAYSNLSPRRRSLWKRIWWSIYIRDRHAAASLGRPCRIRDEDCDVEPLCEQDFAADSTMDSSVVGKQEPYHVSYAISMANLAVLLGRVLALRFSPLSKPATEQVVRSGDDLQRWEDNLPADMIPRSIRQAQDAPFWAAMLQASYHNTVILLYRPTAVVPSPGIEEDWDRRVTGAADSMTRIAEDLLATDTLREGQLHLVPSLFSALGIHAIIIRRNVPIRQQLAENRARQCMLALCELSKSWPVGGWILRLFISLFYRLTGQDLGLRPGLQPRQASIHQPPVLPQQEPSVIPPSPWASNVGETAWMAPSEDFAESFFSTDLGHLGAFDFDFMFQGPLGWGAGGMPDDATDTATSAVDGALWSVNSAT